MLDPAPVVSGEHVLEPALAGLPQLLQDVGGAGGRVLGEDAVGEVRRLVAMQRGEAAAQGAGQAAPGVKGEGAALGEVDRHQDASDLARGFGLDPHRAGRAGQDRPGGASEVDHPPPPVRAQEDQVLRGIGDPVDQELGRGAREELQEALQALTARLGSGEGRLQVAGHVAPGLGEGAGVRRGQLRRIGPKPAVLREGHRVDQLEGRAQALGEADPGLDGAIRPLVPIHPDYDPLHGALPALPRCVGGSLRAVPSPRERVDPEARAQLPRGTTGR